MVREKENNENLPSVGVIIARFQIDELHDVHKEIIDFVYERHKKVIVLLGILGISPVPATKRDPLDFQTRLLMLQESYPDLIISYVKDMKYDEPWSKQVDSKIGDLIAPGHTVMLYGARDSFIPYYFGKYPVTELESDSYVSATIRREQISLQTLSSKDFRIGCIYTAQNQFDMPQTTVDAIIWKRNSDDTISVLLGRKDYETKFQFIGGFSTVNSDSFEEDAKREIWEEVGKIETSELKYFRSKKINDWRYRSQAVKIKTLVYHTEYLSGIITPGDDIVEAAWFNQSQLSREWRELVVENHADILVEFLEKNFKINMTQDLFR
jgi:bifunctional NMN adenylyltransferase/nudix hydrolase